MRSFKAAVATFAHTLALLSALGPAHAADKAAPASTPSAVKLVVRASSSDSCSATLLPGRWEDHRDFRAEFPAARYLYKGPAEGGGIQYCQISVEKAAFVERYPYCALAMSRSDTGHCDVSFSFQGGRRVEFTTMGSPGQVSAVCSFMCLSR